MKNKIVVGIDFGTSGIGYAYGFSENIDKIFLSNLHLQKSENKVPTEIVLDNNLIDILAFGNECKSFISTHEKDKYEYFKNIKMNLYHKIYLIKSTNGKEVDIELIIFKILKKISDFALEQIKITSNIIVKKEDIKWVVTIPAIWEERSKQIMINASIKAGLIDENSDKSLFLALEPEVAGIYYYTISQSCESYKNDHITQGKPYIICDIGAGTVDICTHRKIMVNNKTPELIEEYPPIGGDFGGNKINEEFIKRFIVEIFGEKKVKELRTNPNDEDWDDFEKSIEDKKKYSYENELCNIILDCQIFNDESDDKTLDYYIKEYDKKDHKYKIQKKKKWQLEFSSQIFLDIAKELSLNIFSKIEEICKNVDTKDILMTGAGSKNILITHYLHDLCKNKNIELEFSHPPYPEIAIIKGSVLFGFQKNIIRKRKARYTLGIQNALPWKNDFKEKGKKVKLENNQYFCTNLFRKFITINQYIKYDDIKEHPFIADDSKPNIIFYKTDKENCIYIDEKDENGQLILKNFGNLEFNIGNDFDKQNPYVKVEMKMGGTYIDISAIYLKNGKKINVTQTFI